MSSEDEREGIDVSEEDLGLLADFFSKPAIPKGKSSLELQVDCDVDDC